MVKIKIGNRELHGWAQVIGYLLGTALAILIVSPFIALVLFYLYPNFLFWWVDKPAEAHTPIAELVILSLVCGIGGSLTALVRRWRSKRQAKDIPTLKILVKDYTFENFATLNLITLEYAIIQGALLSYAYFSIPMGVLYFRWGSRWEFWTGAFAALPLSLFLIILARIHYEARAAKWRERQAMIKYYQYHQDGLKIDRHSNND